MKNSLSVLEAKSFKELVYINKGWTNQVLTEVGLYTRSYSDPAAAATVLPTD